MSDYEAGVAVRSFLLTCVSVNSASDAWQLLGRVK
jgi:hypothetical protein